MGYSEVPCKLCHVSFNIGRIRRVGEPEEAGWAGGENPGLGDDGHRRTFVPKIHMGWDTCQASEECQNIVRETSSVVQNTRPKSVDDDNGGDDNDGDEEDDGSFNYHSEEDDEPFEYHSDEDMAGCEGELSERNEAEPEDDTAEVKSRGELQSQQIQGLNVEDESTTISEAEHESDDDPESEGQTEHDKASNCDGEDTLQNVDEEQESWEENVEHLAGPDCEHHGGYSGFEISAEEMKGCTIIQCLIRKSPEWKPEPDDQDFELESDYFLSGLSGQMPSRDSEGPEFTPARHGMDHAYPDTVIFHDDTANDTPMPFHPTCFEVFTRASRLRLGHIDIEGLAGWRKIESTWELDSGFPRHPAVLGGRDQWWDHRRLAAWITANPVLIPSLRSLIHSASQKKVQPSSNDPLAKFPPEISAAVLDLLSPLDRASLRLADCARHLPLSYWQWLLKEDMPWLWEVWDDAEPSFWATTSLPTLCAEKKRKEAAERTLIKQSSVVEEEMPEIWEAWCQDQAWPGESYANLEPSELQSPLSLPAEDTNWCQIHYDIKKHWDELKGLQNRERIWTDAEEILRRIKRYRDEGKI